MKKQVNSVGKFCYYQIVLASKFLLILHLHSGKALLLNVPILSDKPPTPNSELCRKTSYWNLQKIAHNSSSLLASHMSQITEQVIVLHKVLTRTAPMYLSVCLYFVHA